MSAKKINSDLSIEVNEKFREQLKELKARAELYGLLAEGMDDLVNGRIQPFSEAMADIRKEVFGDV